MPVHRVSGELRRTAAEPMSGMLTFQDGSEVVLSNVTIPPTFVDRIALLHWRVRACVGASPTDVLPYLSVRLPPEDTMFDVQEMTMVALQITAGATYVHQDGSIWQGEVVFPDCRIDILANPMVAETVTAVGTLTKEEP